MNSIIRIHQITEFIEIHRNLAKPITIYKTILRNLAKPMKTHPKQFQLIKFHQKTINNQYYHFSIFTEICKCLYHQQSILSLPKSI